MKFNGWQRLWFVILILWTICFSIMSYMRWPTVASVSNDEVYRRMHPANLNVLRRFFKGPHGQISILNASLFLDRRNLSEEFINGLNAGTWKEIRPPNEWYKSIVEVEGHALSFDPIYFAALDSLKEKAQKACVILDCSTSLHTLLAAKRRSFLADVFAVWVMPAIALYALGWAFFFFFL